MDTVVDKKSLKILIVDDETDICELLQRFLSDSFSVSTAHTGEDAWDMLTAAAKEGETGFNLLITDIHLGNMTGLTLLQRVREQLPEIGVVMISGTADTKTAIDAIRYGAFDYVTKPFTGLEELEIIIERWQRMQSLEAKLRQYASLHDDMMRHMKVRTFLCVDVKDSLVMKRGEDPFIAQHAFQEYHRLVKSCVQNQNGAIHSTAGDGVMACFVYTHEALSAARELLQRLPQFNARRHSLRADFKVRLGIHTGSAIVEDDGAINSMFSQTLDATGHLQQQAAVNCIELSEEAVLNLSDQEGISEIDKTVAGLRVYRDETGLDSESPSV